MKIKVDLIYTNWNVRCKRCTLYGLKLSRLKFFRLALANFASVNAALHSWTSEQMRESQTSCSTPNFLIASLEKPRSSTEVFNHTGLENGVGHAMTAPRTALEFLHTATSVWLPWRQPHPWTPHWLHPWPDWSRAVPTALIEKRRFYKHGPQVTNNNLTFNWRRSVDRNIQSCALIYIICYDMLTKFILNLTYDYLIVCDRHCLAIGEDSNLPFDYKGWMDTE